MTIKELLEKPLIFWFDTVLSKVFGNPTYEQLKKVVMGLIDAVETPGNGQEKKEIVIQSALEFLIFVKAIPKTTPIFQLMVYRAILGFLIEAILEFMKAQGWMKAEKTA